MTLYVTRHGETDYNVQKRYAGSTDIPLNANGLRQAEKLAQDLASVKLDVIISSPLLRAKQTAETVRRIWDVPLVVIDEFTEINMGVYEGLTREEAQAQYPNIWTRLGFRPSDDAPTDGETHMQVDARVSAGIAKIKDKYDKNKVLLVCHAFTARVINRQLSRLSFEDMHTFVLGNCEIAEYTL